MNYLLFVGGIYQHKPQNYFVGLALVGQDIVFRFIIEYSSFRDFGP
jgi:hypothetical protein